MPSVGSCDGDSDDIENEQSLLPDSCVNFGSPSAPLSMLAPLEIYYMVCNFALLWLGLSVLDSTDEFPGESISLKIKFCRPVNILGYPPYYPCLALALNPESLAALFDTCRLYVLLSALF